MLKKMKTRKRLAALITLITLFAFKRDDGYDGGAVSVACIRNAYYGQGEL